MRFSFIRTPKDAVLGLRESLIASVESASERVSRTQIELDDAKNHLEKTQAALRGTEAWPESMGWLEDATVPSPFPDKETLSHIGALL